MPTTSFPPCISLGFLCSEGSRNMYIVIEFFFVLLFTQISLVFSGTRLNIPVSYIVLNATLVLN